mgnify:FL=1
MTEDELIPKIDQAAEEGWTELDLAGKNITELPSEISKLARLETLILGKQDFDQKGAEGHAGWEKENDRWIPIVLGNALTSLPCELAIMAQLKVLNLSGNPWRNFPDSITYLSMLN